MAIFKNATLRAAIHLGNDHDVKLRNVQNSSWRTTGQLFGDLEKLISGQTETAGLNLIDSQDLRWISTSLLHTVELVNTPLPRSTSFPTRCCVWEEWETMPINLGRTRSSKKFRITWANHSVIQRISKTGSSSCQFSTTLNGKQEEMSNYATIIRKVLQNTLDNFLVVIGLTWGLDQRKSGTELTMAYQVKIGRKQQRKCCGTLRNLVILYSVASVPWKKDN